MKNMLECRVKSSPHNLMRFFAEKYYPYLPVLPIWYLHLNRTETSIYHGHHRVVILLHFGCSL